MNPSAAPKKIALLVGINDYASQSLEVCVNDANDMESFLGMPEYGFECKKLLNHEGTRKAIRSALEDLFRTPAHTYLFYFSGHGWATDLGVFLVAIDSEQGDEGVDVDLLGKLGRLPAKDSTIIFILDCCHAGAAKPKGAKTVGMQIRTSDLVQSLPTFARGQVLLAACKEDQFAYESSQLRNGFFTSSLLQGMYGEAADQGGCITITSLFDFAAGKFSSSGVQTPVFKGDIAGKLVLGCGFVPRESINLPEERADEIEREAEQHIRSYQEAIGPLMGDLVKWRVEGHRYACQLLEPILDWFTKQSQQHLSFDKRPKYRTARATAIQRQAQLCSLDGGTDTQYGIITERLGSGTFGTVWKLPKTSLGLPLAYKTYHSHDLVLPEKVRRFNHGYSAMKKMDHPHIVKVHQYTQCPLGFYMDYIDGPNLRDFNGTVSEPYKNVQMLRTIGETLRHAHNRGVKHRDVKPENILVKLDEVSQDWLPYLTDFDLAWFSTASQIFTKEALGSVYYASPEQFATPSSASAHASTTDVYSFGQLAFFVMTGSDPVPLGVADNVRALRQRIGEGWFADAAENFVNLYRDCTQQRPESRPQDFSVICDRLFRIEQSLSAVASSQFLSTSEFMREIRFAMVGLGQQNEMLATSSFSSLSRKTTITMSLHSTHNHTANLEFNLHSQETPIIDGIINFEHLRRVLNSRLDSVLSTYPNARKRRGTSAPFQVFIDLESAALNLDGVAQTRKLLSGLLDTIEGR